MRGRRNFARKEPIFKTHFEALFPVFASASEVFGDMLLELVFIHEHVYLNVPPDLWCGMAKQPDGKVVKMHQ